MRRDRAHTSGTHHPDTGPATRDNPVAREDRVVSIARGCRSQTGRYRPRRQHPDNGALETGLTTGRSPRAGVFPQGSRFRPLPNLAERLATNVVATLSRALPASPAPLPAPLWAGVLKAPWSGREGGAAVPISARDRRSFFNIPVRESPLPVWGSVSPGRSSASLRGSTKAASHRLFWGPPSWRHNQQRRNPCHSRPPNR